MNNYYKRLEEAKSLRIHANNLRAHASKYNTFEFNMEEVAGRFDERAESLEKSGELRLHAQSLRACSKHSELEFDIHEIADRYEDEARILEGKI
ncbi:Uncharacterised protein [uncultured archaeon]|nr:Uncharacterised protein [uncultured archaeon]